MDSDSSFMYRSKCIEPPLRSDGMNDSVNVVLNELLLSIARHLIREGPAMPVTISLIPRLDKWDWWIEGYVAPLETEKR